MGLRIAITGIVVFAFCMIMAALARAEPKMPKTYMFFGLIMLAAMASVPIGLIIEIWQ